MPGATELRTPKGRPQWWCKVTVREYAEQRRAAQVHRPSTKAHVETMLRRHVHRSSVTTRSRRFVRLRSRRGLGGLTTTLQPATSKVVPGIPAAVYKAAVRDRRVTASPCEGTKG